MHEEINVLCMYAVRCICIHLFVWVSMEVCMWEFVKKYLCSNFQSRHAPEIHCHLKHTKLHTAFILKPTFYMERLSI